MNFLIDNWYLIVAIFAIVICAGIYIYNYIKTPKSEQLAKVKEWLLIAVVEAEKVFGSKTGELKLRYVYDLFIKTFPYMAKIISFKQFSFYVDEALNKLKYLLENNNEIKTYIEK